MNKITRMNIHGATQGLFSLLHKELRKLFRLCTWALSSGIFDLNNTIRELSRPVDGQQIATWHHHSTLQATTIWDNAESKQPTLPQQLSRLLGQPHWTLLIEILIFAHVDVVTVWHAQCYRHDIVTNVRDRMIHMWVVCDTETVEKILWNVVRCESVACMCVQRVVPFCWRIGNASQMLQSQGSATGGDCAPVDMIRWWYGMRLLTGGFRGFTSRSVCIINKN